jgi:2-polyprenyl-6-methoxyphenol hydroxylase-like FAD-dependent oxidoreductase
VGHLTDWKQVAVLSVESSILPRWYDSGVLLIGDAAHVMSPVGGVGINYAIQDAVVAANVLTGPLLSGEVEDEDLAEVQRERELPTRFIQAVQTFAQNRIVSPVLRSSGALKVPSIVRLALKLPIVRDVAPRIIGFGISRPRLEE